jgi:hypothetical protein
VTVVVFPGAVTVFVWVTVSAFGGLVVVVLVVAAAVAVVEEVFVGAAVVWPSGRLASLSAFAVDDVALGAVLVDACDGTLLMVSVRLLATLDAPLPQPARMSVATATVPTPTPERHRVIARRRRSARLAMDTTRSLLKRRLYISGLVLFGAAAAVVVDGYDITSPSSSLGGGDFNSRGSGERGGRTSSGSDERPPSR